MKIPNAALGTLFLDGETAKYHRDVAPQNIALEGRMAIDSAAMNIHCQAPAALGRLCSYPLFSAG